MEGRPLITIGRIVGVHGVRGNLKVYSYAESLAVFTPGKEIRVQAAGGRESAYRIRTAQPHAGKLLLALETVESRSQAEMLVGCDLLIDKQELPEPEPGEYYWSDLIGLLVFAADETCLGRVTAILQTGSNDVYIVKDPAQGAKHEILIPALESVVTEIDLERGIMRVDLPPGL